VRLAKDPFFQFLALGALVFWIYSLSSSAQPVEATNRIVVRASDQVWLYDNFTKQFRRNPTRVEMRALVNAHVEHELKYREALALGLDQGDTIVRRRMMQKFDFLFGHGAGDQVPDDSILENWQRNNAADFSEPARISFTHLWFSPDSRGQSARAEAQAALAILSSTSKGQEQAPQNEYGDPFPLDVVFRQATRDEIRRVLGPDFAQAVFRAPLNQWTGPVDSGLGIHLVLVTQRIDATLLPFAEVHDSVLEHWRRAESKRILIEMMATLKSEYEIEIDEASLLNFAYAAEVPGAITIPRIDSKARDSDQ